MQPNTTQNTPRVSFIKKRGWRFTVIALIIALSIVGGARLVLEKMARDSAKHVNDYSYQDANLKSTTVSDLTFLRPAEYQPTSTRKDDKYTVNAYTHKESNGYQAGYLLAIGVKDELASNSKYLHDVNYTMDTVDSPDRQKYLSAIEHQVFDSYAKAGYTAELSGLTKFTNDNIKKNAWSFDIKMTNSNPGLKPMQGRLIYIIAPGNFYYLAVMALQSNWNSNPATWQKMANSIKTN